MENGAKEILQYYTIRNQDELINNDTAESDRSVVYLTVNQEADFTSVISTESSDSENNVLDDNSTALGPNVQIITLNDGRIFVTTQSEDENFESVEPHLITSEDGSSNDNVEDKSAEDLNDYEIVHVVDDSQQMYQMVYCSVDSPQEEPEEKNSFMCLHEGCEKTFSKANDLNVHFRSHIDNKPYLCTEEGCGKAFSTSYSLKAHIRTHTGEKPYACAVCEKCFKTSGDLQKHHRTHTGEKPFMCPIEGCGKSFTTSNIRKVHIRSHTGERPYTCSHPGCGKAFSASTNYKNHVRIHSGEKPYACKYQGCGKRFTEYSSLYKHNPVHQSDRPFLCAFCQQKFKLESALKQHKRVKHNVIIASDGTEIIVDM